MAIAKESIIAYVQSVQKVPSSVLADDAVSPTRTQFNRSLYASATAQAQPIGTERTAKIMAVGGYSV